LSDGDEKRPRYKKTVSYSCSGHLRFHARGALRRTCALGNMLFPADDAAHIVKLQTLMHQRCIWSFRDVTRKASNYFRNLTAHLWAGISES